jgi:hypothetical protein
MAYSTNYHRLFVSIRQIHNEELKNINLQLLITFLQKLTHAGGNTLYSEINKFINSVWNEEELPQQWKESIILLIYRKGHKTD